MSDSSDSDEVSVEIPYSQRPEWADIKPISQDSETNDVVRIAYTETFREVYDYFRAILKLNEKSMRAFELSKDAALLNPANYTVWYYRRILIRELKLNLKEELDFITNVIRSNPKNYQVWQHRRNIVEYLNDPSMELAFTAEILKRDSKNYHAWQYRQWVVKKYSLWENELSYIDSLLQNDCRNNSAWNQRYFFISQTHDLEKLESLNYLNDEVAFTLEKIEGCMDNESSWNYLRGLITHISSILSSAYVKDRYPANVIQFCETKLNSTKEEDKSPFLTSFYVEYNLSKARELASANDAEKVKLLVKNSIEMLDTLVTKYDTIRVNYWKYLISKWRHEFANYID